MRGSGASMNAVVRSLAAVATMTLVASGVSAQKAPPPFPDITLPSEFNYYDGAVEALGANFPLVAAWYGLTPAELQHELRRYYDREYDGDRRFLSEWRVTSKGRIVVRESFHYAQKYSAGNFPLTALAPLDSTLSLNSNPSATQTITLRFVPRSLLSTFFWDSTDIKAFTVTEKIAIQHIWTQVAQDFAPFNVNVTTDVQRYTDTNRFDITIRPANLNLSINADQIGFDVGLKSFYDRGSVYLGVNEIERNPSVVAHTISHLLGHALGLRDETDREPSSPYFIPMPPHAPEVDYLYYNYMPYRGYQTSAGRWVPIMGYPGQADIRQFSEGEYPDAVNTSDSFAIMRRNGLSLRPDDYGSSRVQASPLPSTSTGLVMSGTLNGIIERPNDSDRVYVNAGMGKIDASVQTGANVNLGLWLCDNYGRVVASSDPENSLDASVSYNVTKPGTYYLEVVSPAVGTPGYGGFSNYGNRGAYTLQATYGSTELLPPTAQIAMSQFGELIDAEAIAGSPITLNASGSRDDKSITGYAWAFGDGTSVGRGPSFNLQKTYDVPGTYVISLQTTDSDGLSSSSRKTIRILPNPLQ